MFYLQCFVEHYRQSNYIKYSILSESSAGLLHTPKILIEHGCIISNRLLLKLFVF